MLLIISYQRARPKNHLASTQIAVSSPIIPTLQTIFSRAPAITQAAALTTTMTTTTIGNWTANSDSDTINETVSDLYFYLSSYVNIGLK